MEGNGRTGLDFTVTLERIEKSFLPIRYQRKLCSDIRQIQESRLDGLQKVILFGSCARNQMRVGSDIDLLLITGQTPEREVRAELSSVLEEAQDGISTDLVFYTAEEFEKSQCMLVKQIKNDGLILWEV